MQLKDLRTTYRVLSRLDADVPHQLLVTLAGLIRSEERRREYRKIARMSEEELIEHEGKCKRRLRIDLPDGRIIQERTNEATFYTALRELDFASAQALGISVRTTPVFIGFDTPRRQLTHYRMLSPGCFAWRGLRPDERTALLLRLDAELHLHWEIRKV